MRQRERGGERMKASEEHLSSHRKTASKSLLPTFWLVGKVGETIGEIGKQKNSKVNFFTAAIKESVLCCEAVFIYLNGGSVGKESACNAGDLGSIPESERSPRERKGCPLQYSYLENPMDRGVWWVTVLRSQRVGHD